MQVRTVGQVVFSSEYHTFDEAIAGLRKEAEKRGREFPLYDLTALALLAALWVLERAAEKAFDWVAEARKRHREKAADQEAARRHEELCDYLAAVRETIIDARKRLSEGKDIAGASRLLPHPEPPTLEVELGTEAEEDLRDGFEEVARQLPGIDLRVVPKATAPAASLKSSKPRER
jgi:hypothetical protein